MRHLQQRQLLLLLLLLPLLLFQNSCSDKDLAKVSKALVIVAESVKVLQADAIAANNLKLLSDDNTRIIMEIGTKISLAGKESTQLTRNLTKLDSTTKSQILLILQPIITSLSNIINTSLDGITDLETRNKIKVALLSLQTTLNSIQVIVAGGK
jgi:hypothetical protein